MCVLLDAFFWARFLDAFAARRIARTDCTDCMDCTRSTRSSRHALAPKERRLAAAEETRRGEGRFRRWRRRGGVGRGRRRTAASVEFQRFWRDFYILAPFLFSVLRNTRDDLPRETGTSIRTHRRVFILVPFRSVPLCRSVLLLSLFRSVGNDICETSARDTTSTHNICPRHLPPASATFCHVYHYCDVCSACN
jgi:hypothetical protein